MFIDLRERGVGGETSMGCLPYTPQLGIEPAMEVCVLTGNQTRNLLVFGMMLQLRHTARAEGFFMSVLFTV